LAIVVDDPTEEVLRRSLAGFPRPRPSPGFVAAVQRRIAERPPAESRPRLRAGRVLLGVYWLAAGLACVHLLRTLDWPSWTPSVLWALALAVVPLGYVAFLWPDRLGGWLLLYVRPLLAEPTGRAALEVK